MSEQPEGIEGQLDAGLADDDGQAATNPEDARQVEGDPDQTRENLRAASERTPET